MLLTNETSVADTCNNLSVAVYDYIAKDVVKKESPVVLKGSQLNVFVF